MRLATLFFSLIFLPHAQSWAAKARGAEPAPERRVLLVHGIGDDGRTMEHMARYLRAQGWRASTVTLTPNWGQRGLDELAGQIADHVAREFKPGEKFDLVGFSMGGLVARYYVQRLGGLERVRRFVTLSTPHNGTWVAHLLRHPGVRQMRPGSAFLRDLDRDAERLAGLKFTSFWTPCDAIILPPRSSEVPGARNVKMWVAMHPLMIWEPRCLRAVAAALRS